MADPDLSRVGSLIRQLQGMLQGERRVRGTVSGAGAVLRGSGFTAVRTGGGAYTVTFDSAFAAPPSVVVSPDGAGAVAAKVGAVLAGSFGVAVFTTTTGVNIDLPFHFVAVGG